MPTLADISIKTHTLDEDPIHLENTAKIPQSQLGHRGI